MFAVFETFSNMLLRRCGGPIPYKEKDEEEEV
jgi:hypothetical protein